MKHLTAAEFRAKVFDYTKEGVSLSEKPIVVDFYAEWCGPCKRLSPILEEVSQENSHVEIYKVDVDQEPDLAAAFGIRSIPSILFVPSAGTPQMAVGFMNKEALEDAMKQIFKT